MAEVGRQEEVNNGKYETCNEFYLKADSLLLNFTPPEFDNESWNYFDKKEFNLSLAN
jgi:hypothetical protein